MKGGFPLIWIELEILLEIEKLYGRGMSEKMERGD